MSATCAFLGGCLLALGLLAGCAQDIEPDPFGDGGGPGDAGETSADAGGSWADGGGLLDGGGGDAGADGGSDAGADAGTDAGLPPLVWSKMVLPSSSSLYALAGSGASDVYAGDSLGNLLHWNGMNWAVAYPTTSNIALRGLWASDSGELFGAGGTRVLRCAAPCGRTGTLQQVTFANLDLVGVCGVSGGDVYAVGTRGQTFRGALLKWSAGTGTWSEVVADLGVYSVSGCFVAPGGNVFISAQSTILRFDGASFAEETVNFPAGWSVSQKANQYFHAVGGTADAVFAAGTSRAVIRRDPSGTWDYVHGPEGSAMFNALAGAGPLLMAGGARGSDQKGLRLWDGQGWTTPPGGPQNLDVWALYAVSESLWFAAGIETSGTQGVLWRGQR
jgi:hypothetical protein